MSASWRATDLKRDQALERNGFDQTTGLLRYGLAIGDSSDWTILAVSEGKRWNVTLIYCQGVEDRL